MSRVTTMPFGMKKPANPADAASVKLFNLDLHLAVIADVKDTLFRCAIAAAGGGRVSGRNAPTFLRISLRLLSARPSVA